VSELPIPSIDLPSLKPSCIISQGNSALFVENGPFRISVPTVRSITVEDRLGLYNDAAQADSLARTLASLTGRDIEQADALVVDLIRSGAVIEHQKADRRHLDGTYVGYRLVDTFRIRHNEFVDRNLLLKALRGEANRDLAIGYLLEIYFVIRAANWTAPAVLGHAMTLRQRELLESFFMDERDHSELMAEAFSTVDIDPNELRRSFPTAESAFYNHLFYAFGHMSVAHFATSIIMPEVPAFPTAIDAPSDLDLLRNVHGVPDALVDAFESHGDIDAECEHGLVPVMLLAEEGRLASGRVEQLFDVLRLIMSGYFSYLDGVVRRYGNGGPQLQSKSFGDY